MTAPAGRDQQRRCERHPILSTSNNSAANPPLKNPLPPSALLAVATGTLLLVTFGQMPGMNRLWGELQNSGHAPAFCLLAIAVLKLLSPRSRFAHSVGIRHYASVFGLCLLAGVLVEWVQSMLGRSMSLTDIGADTLGTVCGLSGMLTCTPVRQAAGPDQRACCRYVWDPLCWPPRLWHGRLPRT